MRSFFKYLIHFTLKKRLQFVCKPDLRYTCKSNVRGVVLYKLIDYEY